MFYLIWSIAYFLRTELFLILLKLKRDRQTDSLLFFMRDVRGKELRILNKVHNYKKHLNFQFKI